MTRRLRRARAVTRAVVHAGEQAEALGDSQVRPEHLLLGVLAGAGPAAQALHAKGVRHEDVLAEVAPWGGSEAAALRAVGVDLATVRRHVEALFGRGALDRPRRPRRVGPVRSRLLGGHLPFAEPSLEVLAEAVRLARELRSPTGPEHVLLALLAGEDGPVPHALRRLGVDPGAVRSATLRALQAAG